MLRKVFNYNNKSESKIVEGTKLNAFDNTVSACGCLFYKLNDEKQVELLLIKYVDGNWPRLDDFGGQIDVTDENIDDAIRRETYEETNELVDINNLTTNLVQSFYNKKSKYYFKLIRVCDDMFKDTTVFGDTEHHDNIKRTINWYKYEIVKNNLAFRLFYCDELTTYLNSL